MTSINEGPVEHLLAEQIAEKGFLPDPAQSKLARRLDQLILALAERKDRTGLGAWLRKDWLGTAQASAPTGLYILGDVGRGKTMLMDLFFAEAPEPKKLRQHFHSFMRDIHARIFKKRQASTEGDPLVPIAREIASEVRLLCLDEFIVDDIADAMILGRLFTQLFADGVILVTTSNTMPANLYKDGLNRALFLPFIDLLENLLDVFHLEAKADYRLANFTQAGTYFTPLDPKAESALRRLWLSLAGQPLDQARPREIAHSGRTLAVPFAAADLAYFSFAALCEEPLGANDFLATAQEFDTIFIENITCIRAEKINAGKRLMLAVDIFYDQGCALVISAEAPAQDLLIDFELSGFERTQSRLIEMQTSAYLAARKVGAEGS